MNAGDDPLPWELLHAGTIVRAERDLPQTLSVWVECGDVRARFGDGGTRLVLRLAGCTRFEYTPHDEAPVVELAAIVAREPDIVGARFEDGVMQVRGRAGAIRAQYASLALELDSGRAVEVDELRQVVRAHWDDWRKKMAPKLAHPMVRAAHAVARDPIALRALMPALLAAWLRDRTTELATAIEIIDDRTTGLPPVWLEPGEVDAWISTWRDEPGSALRELVQTCRRSGDAALVAGEKAYTPEGTAVRAALWSGFARCAGALLDADPDPRIGRAIEDILHARHSEHWFRVDQVAHAVTSFAKPNDDPSFADHALALLETHADRGTAARLRRLATLLRIESDCNDAEMAGRLDVLAERIAPRFGADTKLDVDIASELESR